MGSTGSDSQGNVTKQEQFLGTIVAVIPEEHTMVLDTAEGEWQLPFYPHDILEAPGGRYECVTSGAVVEDPDMLASWRITVSGEPDGPWTWTANCAPFCDSINPPDWNHEYRRNTEHIRKHAEELGPKYVGKYVLIGERHYAHAGDQVRLIKQ